MVTAKTELGKISTYNEKIDEYRGFITTATLQLNDMEPLKDGTDTYTNGEAEFNAIINFLDKNEGSLYIYITVNEDEESTLYIYPKEGLNHPEGTKEIFPTDLSNNGTDLIGDGTELADVYIYYKNIDEDGTISYKTAYSSAISLITTNKYVKRFIKDTASRLPQTKVNYATGNKIPNPDYKNKMIQIAGYRTEVSKNKAFLNGGNWDVYSVIEVERENEEDNPYKEVSEKSDKNDETQRVEIGCMEYTDLSIENDITITDKDFTLGDWGSDYTIEGNGCVITYPEGANGKLVGTNKGTIEWLGVINGKLASSNSNGSRTTAFEATKNAETGKLSYNIYNAEGVQTPNLPMDGALAYRARPYFGVEVKADGTFGTLAKKTASNTVYTVKWTDNDRDKTERTFYTNATTSGLSHNPARVEYNTFVYVQDTDLDISEGFTEKNVVVNEVCKNAEFTDVAEGNNGYINIPEAFKAEKVSYNRKFTTSTSDGGEADMALASVCLPFKVPFSKFEDLGIEKIMQFSYIEPATNTYWFQYQENTDMSANEPYVLRFKNKGADLPNDGYIFTDLTADPTSDGIEVKQTTKISRLSAIPMLWSTENAGADFLGVLASTNGTILEEGGKYSLYGFGGGKFRPMAATTTNKCPAFRTYVRTLKANNVPAVTFNIGELDEDGNVVSDGSETGVNTVIEDGNAFSVKGIKDALVITSDKAQNVNIYTIGGSLVKAMNVEVGSVTVPVAAGMYIVNGKKVFVK